nr:PKD domain-containing protein [Halolamina pelagica]
MGDPAAATAEVGVDTSNPTAGEPVVFTASNATAATPIVSYDWTFGDGANATGATVDHVYTAAGEYEVTLTITTEGGVTANATTTVSVAAADGGSNDGGSNDGGGNDGGSNDGEATTVDLRTTATTAEPTVATIAAEPPGDRAVAPAAASRVPSSRPPNPNPIPNPISGQRTSPSELRSYSSVRRWSSRPAWRTTATPRARKPWSSKSRARSSRAGRSRLPRARTGRCRSATSSPRRGRRPWRSTRARRGRSRSGHGSRTSPLRP